VCVCLPNLPNEIVVALISSGWLKNNSKPNPFHGKTNLADMSKDLMENGRRQP